MVLYNKNTKWSKVLSLKVKHCNERAFLDDLAAISCIGMYVK